MTIDIFAFLRAAAVALVAFAVTAPLPHAQEAAKPPAAVSHRTMLPPDAVTQHEITLGGHVLAYTATAGTLPLTDAKGETTAEIFYVSFTLQNAGDLTRRPVTYLFNGGPGAASAYLDIGAVGPRALDFGPTGALPPPSDQVVDNPDTWLPFTDLVFIDPVGTGYSRATGGDEAAAKLFWGVSQDLDTLANHPAASGPQRALSSPVYLVGESYGGFRAARLASPCHRSRYRARRRDHGVAGDRFRADVRRAAGTLSLALRLPSYAAARTGSKRVSSPMRSPMPSSSRCTIISSR